MVSPFFGRFINVDPYVPMTASKMAVRHSGFTELKPLSVADTFKQTPVMITPMSPPTIWRSACTKAEASPSTSDLGMIRPPI